MEVYDENTSNSMEKKEKPSYPKVMNSLRRSINIKTFRL